MFPYVKQSLLVVLTIALFSGHINAVASLTHPEDEIVLAEGTAIKLVTSEEITSKAAKPNDRRAADER